MMAAAGASGSLSQAAGLAVRFEWGALPEGAWAVLAGIGAAVVLLAIVFLYRREKASVQGGLRWVCCGLRVLCLALLGVILLRPSIARDVERVQPGLVVILADDSASMSIRDRQLAADAAQQWAQALGLTPDQVRGMQRDEILRGILGRQGGRLLRELSRANQVEVAMFSSPASPVVTLPRQGAQAPAGAPPLPEWKPTAALTDLAGAIRSALARTEPLAAVVLLTDGRQTAAGDVQAASTRAARQGVPLDFVPIGSPSAPANVALLGLESADSAVAGLPLAMKAYVRSESYAGQAARLALSATQAATGQTWEVASQAVTLEADGQRQAVDLTHVPPAAGALHYVARVEPLPGESDLEDNVAARDVAVSEEGIKVLLVAGAPSQDYRFLKALLERDPTYRLTVRLHGSPLSADLPREPEGLMPYEAVVLCDPAPEDATAEWLGMLADLVDREGLGVAFVAGPAYSPELLTSSAGSGKLFDMLPVVVDAAGTRALIGTGGPFTSGWPVELAEAGLGHAITGTEPGVEPSSFWASRPVLFWSLPVERAKPGAAVLLRWANPALRDNAGRGMIVAAAQPYGLGRVFFCGSPETWRWRQKGIGDYERFWLQAVRYCSAGRAERGKRRANIMLDRLAYGLGEPVRISARLYDERFKPLAEDAVELAVTLDGQTVARVPLRRAGQEEGLYGGTYYPERFGRFQLTCTLPDGLTASEPFEVRQPDVEFQDPRADLQTMQQLAAATGGRLFGPAELDQLPAAVPDQTRAEVEPGPLEPLWDSPWLLAFLVAALGAEWVLRKRMGLT